MIVTLPHVITAALGGAVGSVTRYLVSHRLTHWLGYGFPYGTLAVNLAGSLLMGLLMGWLMHEQTETRNSLHALLAVGFLGGFTTFSSFALDIFRMLDNQHLWLAIGYALISVAASVLAVAAGIYITRGLAI